MRRSFLSILIILFTILSTAASHAAHTTAMSMSGTITGTVLNGETGEPVTYAYLHLEEINRTTTTDRNGRFELRNIPEGRYSVLVHRIGFISHSRTLEISRDQTLNLTLELRPTVLSGQTVEVTADAAGTVGSRLEHASIKITGDQLRRDLDITLSGTLANQAGFSQRSMGVAPGRPVIRGLGNERVLILEDGGRTGDVSWTSGDHAVTVSPSSAAEIEIARGPAALEYGAGAIGGVINVVRNQIPTSISSRPTGTLSLQGASVNRGLMGAGSVTAPWNDFVFSLDLNGRLGQDIYTPAGRLNNSYLQTGSSSFGGSYIQPWGYAGLSGSAYGSEYGIPPDPDGGHPDGVDIQMYKYQTEGRTEILVRDAFFNLLEVRSSFTRYHHVELEAGNIIGTQYDMDTVTGSVKLRNAEWGIFDSGVIGAWGEFVDYSVIGSRTPNSNSANGALFIIQETDIGDLHLEGGLRLNHQTTRPETERQSSAIGHVRQRSFTGLETSLSAIYDFGSGFYLGSTFMHSWRAPSLEELYSEGPHLAVYSYEVGNPDLGVERGLGSEIFVRYRRDHASLELAGYYNYFGNFIYSVNTGERRAPRFDLETYQFKGTEAAIYGTELSAEFRLTDNLAIDGSLSLTIGENMDENRPLPMMPPLQGNIGLRYGIESISVGGRLRMAARQDRLGEFETTTPAYSVLDLNAQYRFDWGGTFHTLSLNALNLFDVEYRNHLSIVKDLFPEPGRSVNLLYRVYF